MTDLVRARRDLSRAIREVRILERLVAFLEGTPRKRRGLQVAARAELRPNRPTPDPLPGPAADGERLDRSPGDFAQSDPDRGDAVIAAVRRQVEADGSELVTDRVALIRDRLRVLAGGRR